MSKALLRIWDALLTLGKLEIFGLVMFSIGGIYVSLLLTFPRLLAIATRLL